MSNNNKNFIWASIDRLALLCFQLLALLYLSRILSPYDFGLIAILNIFISFSSVVIDSGMIGALIKKKHAKPIDYYTLFVYNFVLAILFYLILFISAPFISGFYEIPSLTNLVRVLSISLIINSFGYVQIVILTKSYNFKVQSIITIISQSFAVITSIFLAKKGFGVWSLVSLTLTHVIVSTLILIIYNKFLPKLKFSKISFKEQFKFGGPLLISNILFIINTNIYSSLIGKFLSPIKAGYFYQASKLTNTPSGVLSAIVDKVAFTILSKEEKKEQLIFLGHKMYKSIYIIVIPVLLFTYLVSQDLFLVLFNEEWIPAVKVFKILCLSLVPVLIRILNRNLLKSFGNTKTILKIEIINSCLSICILFFTISHGLDIVSYGIFFTNVIMAFLTVYYLNRKLNYSVLLQLSIIIRPLTISLFLIIVLKLILQEINFLNKLDELIIFFFLFSFSYYIINFRKIKIRL